MINLVNNFIFIMPKSKYKKSYDGGPDRFMSYFWQIYITRNLEPEKILEIGIGNKTVNTYLKNQNYDVTSLDIDRELNPDFIGDIRKMPFNKGEFDTIIACEILEHLPWDDFEKSLSELHRVTRKNVIISIPYSTIDMAVIFKPHLSRKMHKVFNHTFRIPLFFKEHEYDGEHYWEMGKRGYSKKKIKNIINKHFNILKETSPWIMPYHYFFVLEKK